MKITRLLILLLALALLAACGNKGDLVRPDAPASAESTAPASATSDAPASARS
jgi:predicted small lipoprotein YifL